MFTGIIETVGQVASFSPAGEAWKLQVRASFEPEGIAVGDSVAVNGCCLTVRRFEGDTLAFDVLEETRRLTNLAQLGPGSAVNLERSLRLDSRMGGHFVTGHIDTAGQLAVREPRGRDHYLQVRVPEAFRRYLVYKGCVAIDGISLTVAEVQDDGFAVWLVPHTLAATNLRTKKAGDGLNLEFDLLAKYVEKIMATRPA